ncbi:MAG: hydroxymethylbilane synthase [Candidatus Eiseniibacteriota bacterium]|nr:MAG: hydroxymethylbilane synthase [Candidatus Eisenbacteria bacterium]
MAAARSIRIGVGPGKLEHLHGEEVRGALERVAPDANVKLVPVAIKKEYRLGHRDVAEVGAPNQLEKALLGRKIDVAVSSMRDVSLEIPKQLTIAAVMTRLTPFDALLCRSNLILDELPLASRVATGSLRVKAQLLHYRPDLDVVWTGVGIEAQMKRMASGVFEAVVISAADAEILGWQDRVTEVFTTSLCLPAAGQGSLCLEVRGGEKDLLALVKKLDDPVSRAEISAEFSFMEAVGGARWLPAGALGRTNGKELVVEGFVASLDGKCLFKDVESGRLGEEKEIGSRLAERILDEGGRSVLSDLAIL